ncbi:MAG: serine hydrolase [Capnocytophaga sp.]|nr:serine hydrolase [Capnocytophaga sp.]
MIRHIFSLFFFIFSIPSVAQIQEEILDELIQETIKTFEVPGISVGIVKDGNVVYSKAFGVRAVNSQKPMETQTLVGIASNSKAFTAVALAMLADDEKLKWDDKVTDYIPELVMYDAFVTRELTIRDLITHRSGLGLGQGDLMFFPENDKVSIQDIIRNVRYLKPKHSFRSKFDYNNIMYIVAGEVISRVSGLSWAEFMEERIFKPVGMHGSHGSYRRAVNAKAENRIEAHAPEDGKVVQIPHDWNETANAAGGILSNIEDMNRWATCLLNGFTTENGQKLVSDKQIQQLWQLQQPIGLQGPGAYNSNFFGYGLGWFLTDVKGHKQVAHTGGLVGTVTQFTLIPDLKLGITVLTNQQSGLAFHTITNTIKDSYLGIEKRDWLKAYGESKKKNTEETDAEKKKAYDAVAAFAKKPALQLDPKQVVGTYADDWFGNIHITHSGKKYRIACENSPSLKGDLLPYSPTIFIARWDNRSYDADAYFIITFDENGDAQKATMKPISKITDFSFDFQNLNLVKTK